MSIVHPALSDHCGICTRPMGIDRSFQLGATCAHCDRLCTKKDCLVCANIQGMIEALNKRLPPWEG